MVFQHASANWLVALRLREGVAQSRNNSSSGVGVMNAATGGALPGAVRRGPLHHHHDEHHHYAHAPPHVDHKPISSVDGGLRRAPSSEGNGISGGFAGGSSLGSSPATAARSHHLAHLFALEELHPHKQRQPPGPTSTVASGSPTNTNKGPDISGALEAARARLHRGELCVMEPDGHVDEVMSSAPELVSVTRDQHVSEVAHHLAHAVVVPVVDAQHRCVGLLDSKDVLAWTASGRLPEDPVVADIAQVAPAQIRTHAHIAEAAELFLSHDIPALPVVDKDKILIGLLLPSDIFCEVEPEPTMSDLLHAYKYVEDHKEPEAKGTFKACK